VWMARAAMTWPAFSRTVPALGGAGLVVGGAYQLTPWKAACLEHCRSPLAMIARHLRPGWRGAVRLGVSHGAFCVACCWGLMAMQVIVGVMSVPMMVLVGAVIAAEKLLPHPEWVVRGVGLAAMTAGLGIVIRSAI